MWRCKQCDSVNVEEACWVDLNTAEAHSADSNDFYCRDCDAPTDVYQDDEEDITDTTPSSVP